MPAIFNSKRKATNSLLRRYFCRMRTLIFFFCIFFAGALCAQIPDTLAPVLDTAAITAASGTGVTVRKPGLVRRVLSKDYPHPRTAAYLSLALPGAGQAYNKSWWKIPVVYSVLGVTTYFEIKNYRQYAALRDNYKWVVDEDPTTNPTEEPYIYLDATSLKNYRDVWKRYFEQTSLVLGLVYVLAATEAFVDAHLSRFDVSEDLSLRLRPSAEAIPWGSGMAFGVGVSLQFGAGHKQPIPRSQTTEFILAR